MIDYKIQGSLSMHILVYIPSPGLKCVGCIQCPNRKIQIEISFLNKNILEFSKQYGWLHHEISNRYEIDNDNSSAFRVSVNNAYFDSNSITTINAIQSVIQTEYTAHVIY